MKKIQETENMNDLQKSISKCSIDGNVVYLTPIHDGVLENYKDVRDAFLKSGAKYQRNTFVFPSDAKPYIDRLMGGEKVNLKKEFQFFATPSDLADELVELANINSPDLMVLEPSGGQGAIINAIFKKESGLCVHTFELMEINRNVLSKIKYCIILGEDFLTAPNTDHYLHGSFHRVIANPPFSKNQDIDHIYKMYEYCKKGGRIVSVASKHWQLSSNKKETEFRNWLELLGAEIIEIEKGRFKESGTMISSVIIVINK